MSILVYGATGYTGKLIARLAKELGVSITLSGRNQSKLQALANETEFEFVAVELTDSRALGELVSEFDVVLHIAGPFSRTAQPMMEACLSGNSHYLDITGEIAIFEHSRQTSSRFHSRGIMTMPGVGFDVVPSDCLSLYIKERMPDATELVLAMRGLAEMSHGTAKTAIEAIGLGTAIRKNGEIEYLRTPPRETFVFGNSKAECVGISWGDVATAYYTTGIPNIAVYFETTPDLEKLVALPPLMQWILKTNIGQAMLRRQIEKQPEGPEPELEKNKKIQILAIARNAEGQEVRSLLHTPGPYYLTAQTALKVAREVDCGNFQPGTHSPAQIFGSQFITQFDGCVFSDIS